MLFRASIAAHFALHRFSRLIVITHQFQALKMPLVRRALRRLLTMFGESSFCGLRPALSSLSFEKILIGYVVPEE